MKDVFISNKKGLAIMTKNEQIASILLEAAELLKNDPEQEDNTLNEGIGSNLLLSGTAAILAATTIGGSIMMIKNATNQLNKEKEEKRKAENAKHKEEMERRVKEAKFNYDNNIFRKNQFIESKSKNIVTINNDDDLRKLILKDARKLVSLCNKSPKVKEEFEKSFKDHFTEEELKDKRLHNFKGLHVEDEGDFIEIINGTQEDCLALHWFISDLADVLEEKWGVSVGTGDGDEGCIYLW